MGLGAGVLPFPPLSTPTGLLNRTHCPEKLSREDAADTDVVQTSPAALLPPEILCKIFTAVISEPEISLWHLLDLPHIMLVCRLWRDVVVGNSSLWSHIDFDYDTLRNQERVSLQLRRSKSLPTHARALFGKAFFQTSSSSLPWRTDRLVSLDMTFLRTSKLSEEDREPLIRIVERDYRPLRSLSIHNYAATGDNPAQDALSLLISPRRLPELRTLRLRDVTFVFTPDPAGAAFLNLVELNLESTMGASSGPTLSVMSNLLGLLRSCARLERLSYQLTSYQTFVLDNNNDDNVVALPPSFQSLSARLTLSNACALLSRLKLPANASIDVGIYMTFTVHNEMPTLFRLLDLQDPTQRWALRFEPASNGHYMGSDLVFRAVPDSSLSANTDHRRSHDNNNKKIVQVRVVDEIFGVTFKPWAATYFSKAVDTLSSDTIVTVALPSPNFRTFGPNLRTALSILAGKSLFALCGHIPGAVRELHHALSHYFIKAEHRVPLRGLLLDFRDSSGEPGVEENCKALLEDVNELLDTLQRAQYSLEFVGVVGVPAIGDDPTFKDVRDAITRKVGVAFICDGHAYTAEGRDVLMAAMPAGEAFDAWDVNTIHTITTLDL